MTLRSLAFLAFATITVGVSSACDGDPGFQPVSETRTLRQQLPAELTIDDVFNNIAARAPGFGGLYMNRQGDLVYFARPNNRAAVRSEVERRVAAGLVGRQPARYIELEAAFDFRTLTDLKRRVFEILPKGLIIWADADETRNRTVLGIPRTASASSIRAALAAAGVDTTAIVLQLTEPLVPAQSIRDSVRPLVGGLEIQRPSLHQCTLGPTVEINAQRGFLTNSHCTTITFGLDNLTYYQPAYRIGMEAGVETIDPVAKPSTHPSGVYTSCPSGWNCRFSDASFFTFATAGTVGAVAETPAPFQFTITQTYQITDASSAVNINDYVRKTGRTTATSEGWVYESCKNVPRGDAILLCQHVVKGAVTDQGDSGAPVYKPTGTTTAMMVGILTTVSADFDGTPLFYYSSTHNVWYDIYAHGISTPIKWF